MFKNWIERTPTIVAAATAAAFVLAVIYEFSYFNVIGWRLRGLLTAEDYVASALRWLPSAFVLWGVGYLQGSAITGILDTIRPKNPNHWREKLVLWFVLLAGVAVAIVWTWTVWDCRPVRSLTLGAIVLLLSFATNKNKPDYWPLIFWSALTIYGTATLGGLEACTDKKRTIANTQLKIEGTMQDVVLLRTIRDGVIYRLPSSEEPHYSRWESSDSLSQLPPRNSD